MKHPIERVMAFRNPIVAHPLPLAQSLATTTLPELFTSNVTMTLILCTFAIVACMLVAIAIFYLCPNKSEIQPTSPEPMKIVWISSNSRRAYLVKPIRKRRNLRSTSQQHANRRTRRDRQTSSDRPTTHRRRPRAKREKPRATINHQRLRLRPEQQKQRRRVKSRKPESCLTVTKPVVSEAETVAQREMIVAASMSGSGEHTEDANNLICSDDIMERTTPTINSSFATTKRARLMDDYSGITSKRSPPRLQTPKPEEDGPNIGHQLKSMSDA